MLEGHEPPHLEPIDTGGALPDLGVQKINMYGNTARPDIVEPLQQMIRQAFASN
jgi:hypothetical protein